MVMGPSFGLLTTTASIQIKGHVTSIKSSLRATYAALFDGQTSPGLIQNHIPSGG